MTKHLHRLSRRRLVQLGLAAALKCRLFRQSALECGQWDRQRLPLQCSIFRIGTGCGRAEARPYHKKPTPEGLAAGGAAMPVPAAWLRPRRNCSTRSLELIHRAAWHAVPPQLTAGAQGERGLFDPDSNPDGWLVYPQPLAALLTTIIVHHSALPLRDGPYEIQQLHLKYQGFADIGYHFLIDAAGCLYEGRSLLVRGAHTRGFNTGTVGIALLGNFETRRPPDAQLATLKRLIICLKARYTLTHLAGHRDFQPGETVCPGRHLAALLPSLATETGLTFGTAGYAGQEG